MADDPKTLTGERVMFADEQFPPSIIDLLTASIATLGGEVTETRREATILLTNPSSPSYAKEVDRTTAFQREYPDLPQPALYPYHWLAHCLDANLRIPLTDIPLNPVFTHPDASKDHAPLLAWVSKNVHRVNGESALAAYDSVKTMLSKAGAIVIEKRAPADVLVVDAHSQFYLTVKKERTAAGRDWQKLAERDWVEDCIAKGMLTIWQSESDLRKEGERESDNESMLDEPVVGNGKGPGRPTGKPRIEYTPQDDDFLCRYLAAHHPDGSWHSRKTYQVLAVSTARYPIADRHSDQSWHERFKKSAAPFSRRIQRLIDEQVDATLKTKKERDKDEMERQEYALMDGGVAEQEGARLTEAALRSLESGDQEAGPSRTVPNAVPAAQIRVEQVILEQTTVTDPAQAAPVAGAKRKLVDLEDSESPPDPPARTAQPDLPITEEDAEVVSADFESLLPASDLIAMISAPPPQAGSLEADRIAVNQSLSGVNAVAHAESNGANHQEDSPHGYETQAILAEFARTKAEVNAEEAEAARQASTPKRKSVRLDVEDQPSSPKRRRDKSATRSPHRHSRDSEQVPRHSPHRHYHEETRPATELIRMLQSLPAPSQPVIQISPGRMSIPVTLELDIRGITTPASASHRHSTPAGRQSLLQEEILNSTPRRIASIDRASRRGSNHTTPDVVYRRTTIPPKRPPTISDSSTPSRLHSRTRSPSPDLTPAERADKFIRGKELVMKMREEYRAKIVILSERYGLTAGEVVGVVNELPKGKGMGGGVYWGDVEEGLRRRFGR